VPDFFKNNCHSRKTNLISNPRGMESRTINARLAQW
jgi:hypothetical protein